MNCFVAPGSIVKAQQGEIVTLSGTSVIVAESLLAELVGSYAVTVTVCWLGIELGGL